MMPPISISGMNAATVVSDDASTGASILREALQHSSASSSPPSASGRTP